MKSLGALCIDQHPQCTYNGGKPLLLGEDCGKAEPSLAPHIPSLGLLHSTQELITALACPTGEAEVLEEVWGAEQLQHPGLLLGKVCCPGSRRGSEVPQVGSIPSKLYKTCKLQVADSHENGHKRTAT